MTTTTALAHGVLDLDELWSGLAAYGSDWLYPLVPTGLFLLGLTLLARRGTGATAIDRVAHAATARTGLVGWAASTLLVLLGLVLPLAVIGFFWDVGWHVEIGRDEFLLSPPHIALLIGVSGIGVAGLVGITVATRDRAATAWRVRALRLPVGPVAMLAAGAAATVGWGIDDLWHRAYGIDVTMWSPPHLGMISSASFTPLAAWLTLAEARSPEARPSVHRALTAVVATAVLIGLSAWQLEFDLGIPQWQALYQPVLIATASAFALVAARRVMGRGGAVTVAVAFVTFRLFTLTMSTQVWHFASPRIPLTVGSALVVEAVLWHRATARSRAGAALAGLGVGTVGLASEWAWSQLTFHQPWQPSLLPGIATATVAAVAAAVLATSFADVIVGASEDPHDATGDAVRRSRRSGSGALPVLASVAVLAVTLALPFPRRTPTGDVTVLTQPAGDGRVDVTVRSDRTDLVSDADRFEVFSWQGDGRELTALEPSGPGTYRTVAPVPVGGDWKTMVMLSSRDRLGAAPIYLAPDPIIDLATVPVAPERTAPWVAQTEVMLREATDGPTWPSVLAYGALAASQAAILGTIAAGAVALDRRRRGDDPARVLTSTSARPFTSTTRGMR